MANIVRLRSVSPQKNEPMKQYVGGAKYRFKRHERERLYDIVSELIKLKLESFDKGEDVWEWNGAVVVSREEIVRMMFGDYAMKENHEAIWRWLWQTFDIDWPKIQARCPELLVYKKALTLTENFMKRFYGRKKRPMTAQEIISAIRHSGNKRGFGILICDAGHLLPGLLLEVSEKSANQMRLTLEGRRHQHKMLLPSSDVE